MIQQLVQLQPITAAAAELNREAFILLFPVHRCRSRAGRGWRKRHNLPYSSFFSGIIRIVVSSAHRPERSRRAPQWRLTFLGRHPPGGFYQPFLGFCLRSRPVFGWRIFFVWIRRTISGPDVQLVPFDLSSAISAFGRWMLSLPGRWVPSVLESSLTPWNLTWKNQHGYKIIVSDVHPRYGRRLITETNN